MPIFYTPHITKNSHSYTLSVEESKHAVRVLRLKNGDKVRLVNGSGLQCEASVAEANPKATVLNIDSFQELSKRADYHLHIAVAPTKNMDRIEWFLEKSIEIGIDAFTPIICQNSERKKIKIERLERIAVAAMKQSKSAFLPLLNEAVNFEDFISHTSSIPFKGIAHCIEGKPKRYINEVLSPKKEALILIGPEGDFTVEEIKWALTHGFQPIHLGENRLRTETAALASCVEVAIINR